MRLGKKNITETRICFHVKSLRLILIFHISINAIPFFVSNFKSLLDLGHIFFLLENQEGKNLQFFVLIWMIWYFGDGNLLGNCRTWVDKWLIACQYVNKQKASASMKQTVHFYFNNLPGVLEHVTILLGQLVGGTGDVLRNTNSGHK